MMDAIELIGGFLLFIFAAGFASMMLGDRY